MKAKLNKEWNGKPGVYTIFCPGCDSQHLIPTQESIYTSGAVWHFSGTVDSPTFRPSLVVTTGTYVDPSIIKPGMSEEQKKWIEEHSERCHAWISNGYIQYLGDCTHKLKNQTVPLPDLDKDGLPL